MAEKRDPGALTDDVTVAVMGALLELFKSTSHLVSEEGMQLIKAKLLRDSRIFVGDVVRSTTHLAIAQVKLEDARRMKKFGARLKKEKP